MRFVGLVVLLRITLSTEWGFPATFASSSNMGGWEGGELGLVPAYSRVEIPGTVDGQGSAIGSTQSAKRSTTMYWPSLVGAHMPALN